jgi:membrane associated rhomboid family serine protease
MNWLIWTHLAAFIAGVVLYGLYARKIKLWTREELEKLRLKL